jgi:hypothetical protein
LETVGAEGVVATVVEVDVLLAVEVAVDVDVAVEVDVDVVTEEIETELESLLKIVNLLKRSSAEREIVAEQFPIIKINI